MFNDPGQLLKSSAQAGTLTRSGFQQDGHRCSICTGLLHHQVKMFHHIGQTGLNSGTAMAARMKNQIGNTQGCASPQLLNKGGNRLCRLFLFSAAEIDQVRGMGGDRHVACILPGPGKGDYLVPAQGCGFPLALVPGEQLQRFPTDLQNTLKGQMQPAGYGFVGSE